MACEYCGNKSHRTDDRGNCIGCGAPIESLVEPVRPISPVIGVPRNPLSYTYETNYDYNTVATSSGSTVLWVRY